MIFNSLTFVLFFAVVLVLHNLLFPWRVNPPFVALIGRDPPLPSH